MFSIHKTFLEDDNRERNYLVHSSYFWNIEYRVGTVLVIVGSDFSLKEKEENVISSLLNILTVIHKSYAESYSVQQ